jgi:hypothetical protein
MTDEFKSPSTSELFDEASPSKEAVTASPEKEVEKKAEDKAVEEKSEEKSEEKESESEEKSEKTDETKDKASSETKDKPSTEDSTIEEQLKEARKWGNEKNQEALKALETLKKFKEEHGIDDTVDDTEAAARLEERIQTSEAIERENHGDEYIDKMIYADDSAWKSKLRHDPLIDYRVRNAKSPISEALKVVKEQEFHDKYGNDPEKIVKAIKKEVETDVRKELKEEYEKKLKGKEALGSDLSNVKSDEVKSNDKFRQKSTAELFG